MQASRTPEQRAAMTRRLIDAMRGVSRGKPTHGMTGTPTYSSWRAMKFRCLNPNSPDFARYGGRGITVDPRWRDSFEAFLADLGPRPEGTTLHRIDGDGDYEPGNVVWADASEQAYEREARRRVATRQGER